MIDVYDSYVSVCRPIFICMCIRQIVKLSHMIFDQNKMAASTDEAKVSPTVKEHLYKVLVIGEFGVGEYFS